MKYNLVPLFLTFFWFSQGQEALVGKLSGVITDATGKSLPYASIYFENLKKGVLTDNNGNYSFNKLPLGKHQLVISFVGYSTVIKTIEFNKKRPHLKIDFILDETTEQLNEVTINGKTEKTKKETQGFAVNAIETKEASLRNIQTNELLNTTVGVKIRQNGGLGSNVQYSLNGLSGNSVRIFIDGIPISMFGSSFSLNSIPPTMIENIEVYKGVVPGHLSSDALGGAINIVLKKGTKTNFNAAVSYGSFNTFQTSVNGLYRLEKSGFTVKASSFYNYSDNDYKVWGGQVIVNGIGGKPTAVTGKRFNDAYKSIGGMAQIGFTDVTWADQFFVGITASDDYKEIQHGAFMTRIPYHGRFRETDATLANLTYQKKNFLTKGLHVNINGFYGKRKTIVNDTTAVAYNWLGEKAIDYNGNYFSYSWGSQQEGGPTLTVIDRNVASIRSNISYTINDHHKVLLNHLYSGLDREDWDEIKSNLANTFKQTSDLYKNIYTLSYELEAFKEKLNLNFFGKHYRQIVINAKPVFNDDETEVIINKYQSDKNYNGYGLATSYDIASNITLLLSTEKAIRLPSDSEVFGDVGDNIVSNTGLKPEISYNYNAGFRLGKFYFKKNTLTVTTNFFSRNITDLIGLPLGAGDRWENDELVQYANFNEESKSKGIDFDLNYSYNNNFGFNFNLSRLSLKTKNRAGYVQDVPNVPLFTMNGALRYSIKNFVQNKSRLNLFYNAYFTDEFSYKMDQGINTKDDGAFLIPQQFSQDLGLSYVFPKENFVLSFDAKNIFNKAVYDNQSVQKPGRAFYLKLNYTINKF